MVGCRHGIAGIGMSGVIDNDIILTMLYSFCNILVEGHCLRAALLTVPVDAPQVVHHVAAAHDEVALAAQWSQKLPYLVALARCDNTIDRELHDGNVGIGKHMHEWRPRAVVDAPSVVDHRAKLLDAEDSIAQLGTALDRIFHFVESTREAVHIVDLLGLFRALDEVEVLVPMSRNHQNGFRAAIVADDALTQ